MEVICTKEEYSKLYSIYSELVPTMSKTVQSLMNEIIYNSFECTQDIVDHDEEVYEELMRNMIIEIRQYNYSDAQLKFITTLSNKLNCNKPIPHDAGSVVVIVNNKDLLRYYGISSGFANKVLVVNKVLNRYPTTSYYELCNLNGEYLNEIFNDSLLVKLSDYKKFDDDLYHKIEPEFNFNINTKLFSGETNLELVECLTKMKKYPIITNKAILTEGELSELSEIAQSLYDNFFSENSSYKLPKLLTWIKSYYELLVSSLKK